MSMIDLHAASSGPPGESRMCMIDSKMYRVRLSMKHAREQARGLGGVRVMCARGEGWGWRAARQPTWVDRQYAFLWFTRERVWGPSWGSDLQPKCEARTVKHTGTLVCCVSVCIVSLNPPPCVAVFYAAVSLSPRVRSLVLCCPLAAASATHTTRSGVYTVG
jgi:hypothetical protein